MKKNALLLIILCLISLTLISCGKETTNNNTVYTPVPGSTEIVYVPASPTQTSSPASSPTESPTASPTFPVTPTETPFQLSGKVFDRLRLGQIIVGAEIKISKDGTVVATTTSDGNGYYTIDLYVGTYGGLASMTGYNSMPNDSIVINNNTEYDWELFPIPSAGKGNVLLQVYDSQTAEAIAEAIAKLNTDYESVRTNADGEYAWFDLSPGVAYSVNIQKADYMSANKNFYAFSDRNIIITIYLNHSGTARMETKIL